MHELDRNPVLSTRNFTPARRIVVAVLLTLAVWSPLILISGYAATKQASAQAAPPAVRRRNVLLLISDDQGRDVMGAYGNPIVKTPNQDRLAAEGVRFTNAFATVASCSPSRASIFTGTYQHQNGQYGLAHATHNQHTFESVRAAPRVLSENGYRTAIIGKHHVVPLDLYGFQRVIPAEHGSRDVAGMARSARAIFAEQDARPFFLTIGYADPHRGGMISDSMPDGRGNFANERQYAGVTAIKYKPADVPVPAHLPDTPEVRAELAHYYEAVSRLDQGIGMVMQALRDTNQLENTLVIYISDNGIPFPGAKTNLYDAGIRLPMLMRVPGQTRRGTINDAMVSFIDIAPTLLGWAGVEPAKAMIGRSLLPIINEESPAGWNEVFASHTMHEITMYYPMRAVRTREYKLIWNLSHEQQYPEAADLWNSPTWQGILKRKDDRIGARTIADYLHRPEYELYDVRTDPEETRNLAADPRHKTVLVGLQARLRSMMERTKDPWTIEFRSAKAG